MELNLKYTPESIASDSRVFSIPLYQRLFEWDKPQITQLLNDLYDGFEQKPNEPYYIGMLTAHNNDLVDGQQRFTVLMLMSIAFKWDKFYKIKTSNDKEIKPRLTFFARKKDEIYLVAKLKNEAIPDYKNAKMEVGIQCIIDFVGQKNKKEEFIKYVYKQLTFFISELPTEYKPEDLNRYFEAMNATGRSLENHEILKVDLLKKVSGDKKVEFTRIWNAVADMDKPLLQQWDRKDRKESAEDFKRRHNTVLQLLDIDQSHDLFELCNASKKELTNNSEFKSIRDIKPNNIAPNDNYRSIGERAILNFPEFLLQVLRLQIGEEEQKRIPNFFNVHKLQETFAYLNRDTESVELFFQNLLKYRILFDYFIIRVSNKDDNTTTYTLAFNEDCNENTNKEKLIKYQSMLYVSTSSNIWLTNLLSYLAISPLELSLTSLYDKIVDFDNQRHGGVINLSLKYGGIDRYWFWRLDYYLWENKEKYFKEKALDVAKNYIFRTNRSIEHIAPQTPEENSAVELDKETMLDWFGNLAMISSGQNSSLQNRSYEVKKAHVNSFVNNSKDGSIESLKLLKVIEYDTWDKDKVKKHGNEMIDILLESFPNDGYEEIKNELKNSKLI
jgi:uncharacterized protein with ParB-like and HNH nuclease domain